MVAPLNIDLTLNSTLIVDLIPSTLTEPISVELPAPTVIESTPENFKMIEPVQPQKEKENLPVPIPLDLEARTTSPLHLPYVRVSAMFQPRCSNGERSYKADGTYKRVESDKFAKTGKASEIAQVVSSLKAPDDTPTQPIVIKVQNNSRVTTGSAVLYSRSPASVPISLIRPVATRSKYARSSNGSLSSRSNLSASASASLNDKNTPFIIPGTVTLPFLRLTNALQLHLKMNVLDAQESIHSWTPGSFMIQSSPFTNRPRNYFSFGFTKEKESDIPSISSTLPGYLLVTKTCLYLFRPNFLLQTQNQLVDDQTTYVNPSLLLKLYMKCNISDLVRVDVGPGRQYIVFRLPSLLQKQTIESIVFLTSSKSSSTLILDHLKTQIHDYDSQPSKLLINQDIEWANRNFQHALVQSGPKSHTLYSYDKVWTDEMGSLTLADNEVDASVEFEISKVDFEFVILYSLGALLRYLRPSDSMTAKGVEVLPVTLAATSTYLYLLRERLDVWPPLLIPSEFSPQDQVNQAVKSILESDDKHETKGSLADLVPQYDKVWGVGRICEIVSVERWRTWRIDSALSLSEEFEEPSFQGLGHFLQNGCLGYFDKRREGDAKRIMTQEGCSSGFLWWVRIVFGKRIRPQGDPFDSQRPEEPLSPIGPPRVVPVSSDRVKVDYWWDVSFGSRESTEEFMDGLKLACQRASCSPEFIVGDD